MSVLRPQVSHFFSMIFWLSLCVTAQASQKVLGVYDFSLKKSIAVGCIKQDIKALQIKPVVGKNCTSEQGIASIAITYAGGFTQLFEYPEATPIAAEHTYNVLPDTQCIENISLALVGNCKKSVQIDLVY